MADKEYIREMLGDVGGSISHKRVITFSAFCFLSLAFLVNIFFEVKIEEFIYDGMLYVVAAGMGFSVAEYFSKRGKGETKQEPEIPLIVHMDDTITETTTKPPQPDIYSEEGVQVTHKVVYPQQKKPAVTEIINEGITEISGILQGEN